MLANNNSNYNNWGNKEQSCNCDSDYRVLVFNRHVDDKFVREDKLLTTNDITDWLVDCIDIVNDNDCHFAQVDDWARVVMFYGIQ